MDDYNKCIDLDSQNFAAYFNRGMINKFFSNFENAISDFDQSVKINPNFLDAYQNRAVLKSQMKNKEALNDFNKVIELNPKEGESYFNRAIYYLNNNVNGDFCGDLNKALQLGFSKALEVINDACKKSK